MSGKGGGRGFSKNCFKGAGAQRGIDRRKKGIHHTGEVPLKEKAQGGKVG